MLVGCVVARRRRYSDKSFGHYTGVILKINYTYISLITLRLNCINIMKMLA